MPILNIDNEEQVIVVKRSMSPGHAGIINPLFVSNNTKMLFSDAKVGLEEMFKSFKLV